MVVTLQGIALQIGVPLTLKKVEIRRRREKTQILFGFLLDFVILRRCLEGTFVRK